MWLKECSNQNTSKQIREIDKAPNIEFKIDLDVEFAGIYDL